MARSGARNYIERYLKVCAPSGRPSFTRRWKDIHNHGSSTQLPRNKEGPRSRVFGMWVADVKTEWGDPAKFPVIANSQDLQLFRKVLNHDTFYTWSELHGSWICLTKQSGEELSERTLTPQEQPMFREAKISEVQNLEGGNAIEFVTDAEEIVRVLRDLPHRVMPSHFILTKKMQEVDPTWSQSALDPPRTSGPRWIESGAIRSHAINNDAVPYLPNRREPRSTTNLW